MAVTRVNICLPEGIELPRKHAAYRVTASCSLPACGQGDCMPAPRAMSSVEAPLHQPYLRELGQRRLRGSPRGARRPSSARSSAPSSIEVRTHSLPLSRPIQPSAAASASATRSRSLREPEWNGSTRARSKTWSAPGKVPWSAYAPQPVQRVGPDLRLDPARPQRPEHLVAPVDLDHVRLPAVTVSLVGDGRTTGRLREPLP